MTRGTTAERGVASASARHHSNPSASQATKKKQPLAGRGGIGVPAVEDRGKQCPSWLASRQRRRWLQRGFSGQCLDAQRRRSARRLGASHRVSPARRRAEDTQQQQWARRLSRSSGKGSGLRSQADGTTTRTRTRSSTRCISTSGCSCYASPSLSTW